MSTQQIFNVTVACTYGLSDGFVEEVSVHTESEAKQWARQFRKEYPADCGYKVKVGRA